MNYIQYTILVRLIIILIGVSKFAAYILDINNRKLSYSNIYKSNQNRIINAY